MPEPDELPGAADVRSALSQIQETVHRTPVITCTTLDAAAGRRLFLKAESFQMGGSFKIRGALNKISRLGAEETARGVVASSSGNHAQAVAIAARLRGAAATIVMPVDAIASKVEATRAYGASILYCDRSKEDLEERAIAVAAERGATLVHPFEDRLVIAGQGTVALELLQEVPDLDALIVPVGGGGLLAGCALIARELNPAIRIFGVEPEHANDTRLSLESGTWVRLPVPRSVADGQLVPQPGAVTFAVNRQLVDEVLLVSDAQIVAAMRDLFERAKLVVEPSGASALAAALAHAPTVLADCARVGVVVSGGNVDAGRFAALMQDSV